ncbi:hypothetical protein MCOR25_002997 [Pyricularia grisea]|nr:hypothetical protein MCOR25_002997 [Pyricularia grisea]
MGLANLATTAASLREPLVGSNGDRSCSLSSLARCSGWSRFGESPVLLSTGMGFASMPWASAHSSGSRQHVRIPVHGRVSPQGGELVARPDVYPKGLLGSCFIPISGEAPLPL